MRTTKQFLGCVLAAITLAAFASRETQAVNRQAELFKEFNDRVKKYVDLQKSLEKKLPHLSDKADAAAISAHEVNLAKLIREARANARPGDIFLPEVQPLFKQIIRANLKGPTGQARKKATREGNPKVDGDPAGIQVKVNAPYPSSEPMSTMPPGLLLNLPQLPEEVTFRFVGRDLILRDSKAALIIDYIREVTP